MAMNIPAQHHHRHAGSKEPVASTHRDTTYMMHGAAIPVSPVAANIGSHNISEKSARPTRPTASSRPAPPVQKSAVRDLLPFCTSTLPLGEAQVVNLSDMAGSLKEVMLIAMQAAMDDDVMAHLQSAVGEEAAEGIVNFFSDEFQI
ncbi:hypothetical protein DM02DRAFT_43530 [Periconia macrospinosa]|uniref:Uncharacterized protein n=1 Tax=Periconia macrospinosa TaxID=97972 RepID=A0A2V1DK84_9PLEO|nr:hypothetical protein DM02DRAFT_43530 [Periconia macrospinosa]